MQIDDPLITSIYQYKKHPKYKHPKYIQKQYTFNIPKKLQLILVDIQSTTIKLQQRPWWITFCRFGFFVQFQNLCNTNTIFKCNSTWKEYYKIYRNEYAFLLGVLFKIAAELRFTSSAIFILLQNVYKNTFHVCLNIIPVVLFMIDRQACTCCRIVTSLSFSRREYCLLSTFISQFIYNQYFNKILDSELLCTYPRKQIIQVFLYGPAYR